MVAPRLTFLYPHIFRHALRTAETCPQLRARGPGGRVLKQRLLHSTSRHYNNAQATPYTSPDRAIPLPQPGEGSPQPEYRSQGNYEREGRSLSREDGEEQGEHEGEIIDVAPSGNREELDAGESHPPEPVPSTSLELSTRPMERVLHMDSPSSRGEGRKPPHLHAPPYVHHFDTYSLVRDLQNGGFSQDQSISLMKAVRGILASNMQLARDGLVSKSDVENEAYLFRAACDELKTEVQNSRRATAEKMRSERAHLQHEVDILGQKVTQETTSLKDEVKGMFDDRKMSVRMEQRSMESKIQELNYKIQSVLTGQSKGEVEGLRWFLTRRAAIFIGGLAVAVIVGIQYSVHMSHNQHNERKKAKDAEAVETTYTISPRNAVVQGSENTDALLSSMDTKTGQNYVSLG